MKVLQDLRQKDPYEKVGLGLLGAVCGLLIVVIFIRLRGGHSVIFDDSYMYVRYALNFWEHGTFGWNPEAHSYGCTSMLYGIWVTLWTPLFPVEWEAYQLLLMGSSLLFSMIGIGLLFSVLRILFPDDTARWMWILPLICAFPFLGNSLNGMDTTMSFASIALMVFFWLKDLNPDSWKQLILLAIVSYLPFLVRPDNGFYVLLIPFIMVFRSWRRGQIIRFYLILGALLAADLLFKFLIFGSPVPLPFFSKSDSFFLAYRGMTMWPLHLYWLYFITIGGLPLLIGMLRQTPPYQSRGLLIILPVLLTLMVLSSKIMVMGGFMRFFYPSLIGIIVAGFLIQKGSRLLVSHKLILVVWSILSFGGIFLTEYQERKEEAEDLELVLLANPDSGTEIDEIYPVDALFLVMDQMPNGATVAGSEHGRLSVQYPNMRIMDLMGLHDKEIALNGYSDEYLSVKQPEVVWMAHDHYVGLNHQILNGAYFREAYEFFPGAAQYGMAVRKDLPEFELLKSLILSQDQGE